MSISGNLGKLTMFWALAAYGLGSGAGGAQSNGQTTSVIINGRSGEVNTVMFNNRQFVDLESLVRAAQGALNFQGTRIILTVPASAAPTPPSAPVAQQNTDSNQLSQAFVKAGIEEIALLREWASPLAYAMQNGYPITGEAVSQYRAQAASGLQLAKAAAQTDADHNAVQLLNKEFTAVDQWANKLLQARKSMDAANYAMSHSALRDDPLSQKILACGHFLTSMLGSGTFQDDGSCD